MKILFAIDTETEVFNQVKNNQTLIQKIKTGGNKVGIFNTGKVRDYNTGVLIDDVNLVKEKEWDLIVVAYTTNLVTLRKKIKNKPIIYIAYNDNANQRCINVSNLFKVITINSRINPKLWGIPKELINEIRFFNAKKINDLVPTIVQDNIYKIAYFVDEEDKSLELCRAVIRAFNFVPFARLEIITNQHNVALLKNIANINIRFTTNYNYKSIFCRHDVIVASKSFAVQAIMNKKPTFVLGSHGIGGYVDSTNIMDFIRTGFYGRIGGICNEPIPTRLLIYMLLNNDHDGNINTNYNLSNEQYDMLEKKYGGSFENLFIDEFYDAVCLYEKIKNPIKSGELFPKISESLSIEPNSIEGFTIINRHTGLFITSLGNSEHSLISNMNGKICIKDIIKLNSSEFTSTDIIDFIYELWENKIIVFIKVH